MPQQNHERRWLIWAIAWAVNFGLWLAFVSQAPRAETYVGLAAAAVATFATWVFCAAGLISFVFYTRYIAQIWRVPWDLLTDTIAILRALLMQLFTRNGAPSLLRAVEFDVGGDDPSSAARRALAVSYATMTPNFIALGFVRAQQLLLFHQILPSDIPAMTRNLGAKP